MHYLIKGMIPPILKTLKHYSFRYGWKGDFTSFTAAKKKCKGYDEQHIVNRIVETTTKVVNGEAAYERDGILYDKIRINPNLLNVLLTISARNNNEITVIDFGGSLGTTYYQNIQSLSHLSRLNWCIVEQPNYIAEGKKHFENDTLRFYESIEECLKKHPSPDLLLISSVLQYLPEPYAMLKHFQSFQIPNLLIDLVAYNDKNKDRITIQWVPPVFYGKEACYPCTFFDKQKLHAQLASNYTMEHEFISEEDTYFINFKPFKYEGSYWKLSK